MLPQKLVDWAQTWSMSNASGYPSRIIKHNLLSFLLGLAYKRVILVVNQESSGRYYCKANVMGFPEIGADLTIESCCALVMFTSCSSLIACVSTS